MTVHPRVLIEDWLPVEELGIESRREAAPIPGQFPKLKTIHVWWARRPLSASAAVVLASLLPAWSSHLAQWFATEDEYRKWVLSMAGVLGDPIAARRAQDAAIASGRRIPNPYTYKPAFKNRPGPENIDRLHEVLKATWGDLPNVLDPTAGGGSIPFVSARYRLPTAANDLNPVAATLLRSSVEYPVELGAHVLHDLERYAEPLVERVRASTRAFFPRSIDEQVKTYIFARSVDCPRTGKTVPLAPDWWLRKGKDAVAVRLITRVGDRPLDRPHFELATGREIDFDPGVGTIRGGSAVSPWDGLVVDGDYIKDQAQRGHMRSVLYAVAVVKNGRRTFRAPTPEDLQALDDAETYLDAHDDEWSANGVLPTEEIDAVSNYDRGHRLYGIRRWREMFSPRQLVVHASYVEHARETAKQVLRELEPRRAKAVLTMLALIQGKALNWNALSSTWDTSRQKTRSVFEKHNFAFKWTYAEFEGADALYPWALEQVSSAYAELVNLLGDDDGFVASDARVSPVVVSAGNAADLHGVPNESVALVCMDPPYYDNVMYAELSDFFYVWQRLLLTDVEPEWFNAEGTDKDLEAIANEARFAFAGRRKAELADADYEAKMTAIFAEARRVLRDDGVLTVMFTHKRAEAWDTLGMALMQSGFTIETSWPVHTESDVSLHQSKKNAATSTIMLVCRKRPTRNADATFFENLEGDVRSAARQAAERFERAGISGVDLMLASYGPALGVISSAWPVHSSEADPTTGRARVLRPEEALEVARAEIVRLRKQRLLGRAVTLDVYTDFVLLAWQTFMAPEFPFDEARRLALAVGGLDTDDLVRAKYIARTAGTVRMMAPHERLRRGGDSHLPGVRLGATTFANVIDAVHTAMYVLDEDGATACRTFLQRAGLLEDAQFLAAAQGLLSAVPRDRKNDAFVLPEADTLDRLRLLVLPDLPAPPDPVADEVQLALTDA